MVFFKGEIGGWWNFGRLVKPVDWWNWWIGGTGGLVELVDRWNWWIGGTGGFVELLD
jgi:hypothetical protein